MQQPSGLENKASHRAGRSPSYPCPPHLPGHTVPGTFQQQPAWVGACLRSGSLAAPRSCAGRRHAHSVLPHHPLLRLDPAGLPAPWAGNGCSQCPLSAHLIEKQAPAELGVGVKDRGSSGALPALGRGFPQAPSPCPVPEWLHLSADLDCPQGHAQSPGGTETQERRGQGRGGQASSLLVQLSVRGAQVPSGWPGCSCSGSPSTPLASSRLGTGLPGGTVAWGGLSLFHPHRFKSRREAQRLAVPWTWPGASSQTAGAAGFQGSSWPGEAARRCPASGLTPGGPREQVKARGRLPLRGGEPGVPGGRWLAPGSLPGQGHGAHSGFPR